MNHHRLGWDEVPTGFRRLVEEALGSTVRSWRNESGGFSPSLAARCELGDGRRVFVKVASAAQNPRTPDMIRHEIAVAAVVPSSFPAPPLVASVDDGDWVAAVFQEVPGRPPLTPWTREELAMVVAAVERLAASAGGSGATLAPVEEVAGPLFAGWRTLAATAPLPAGLDDWSRRHLDRLAEIEAGWPQAGAGQALLHFDIRNDNVVLDGEQVWFVDWATATRGAAWIDLVAMLPSVPLDGGPEPEVVWANSRLAATADPSAVDAVVVALAGYFTRSALEPPPVGLPTVRQFQAAQGEVARRWAAARCRLA